MVSGKVKLLDLKGSGEKYRLTVEVNKRRRNYDVTVFDRAGIFGVEFPDELGLMLRNAPDDNKNIVSALKAKHQESFTVRKAA